MLRRFFQLFIVLFGLLLQAQDFSGLWRGHFSYYEIVDVSRGDGKVYAASENAIFSYNTLTNEIKTITTVQGLSGELISTISYSEDFKLLMVGYENGLIEIVFDGEEDILSVVDILEKTTISPEKKIINHFNENEGLVYISTDYGISVYDLNRLEFGDSYFIGNFGTQIKVNQTTILDNSIYAACGDNNGIKVAAIDNPNLVDSEQWQTISTGTFQFIQAVDNRLYTINNNKNLFEIINNSLQQRRNFSANPQDMRVVDNHLIVTTDLRTLVFDSDLTRILAIEIPVDLATNYNASTMSDTHVYIGTTSLGLIEFERKETVNYNIVRPEGPLRNDAFKLEAHRNELWVSFGDYTVSFNPSPVRRYGLSHLIDDKWINIPYDSLLGATNLNYISISPFVANEVYVSSFQDGMLKLNDNEATILYNETNSGLESLSVPGDPNVRSIRISGNKFDDQGTLWVLNSRVDEALKSFDPTTGQWRGYSFGDIIENPLLDELGFQEIAIDDNGTKWIASYNYGVIGFNENIPNGLRNISTQEQGFETTITRAVAVDNRNQLWIGTIRGLRVLYNTSNFFEAANPTVRDIVFVDDGIPKELLAGQFITDIKVDGSNNKWVGTLDSGLFYFSSDGQETIYHFTKDNSPLPSNIINDISIDFSSGRVYIATRRGLVSFLAGGSEPSDELSDAFVYPNPVRPEYNILGFNNLNDINQGVKVKGLTENVNIKITDIEGNLVAEAQSGVNIRSSANYNFAIDGGTAVWNGRNLANNIVASGVYLFMISDLDSFETKVLKLLVIR